ncbi:hypothetical protein NQD34_006346 [Periophthalmus magnuspinnatus]|uniref:RING finger protein 222 n=1 Tax=Periophthalmus magnuspinnatus TaxID=409849 RepID=UPI00145AF976|nr:RING finger protein 222 [Periophthalmus magnuspinnatus]KAJ0001326.1 hypothetical protein NQD34_006346 [Periophthalmus magnuspinnatus]
MAFLNDDHEDGRECPVCYESLSGTERTLSCGHVFCHDCLVKTLVSVNTNGNIRDTIVCPICRHLTFIKKQKEAVVSFNADKDVEAAGQTLEVPVPLCSSVGQQQHLRASPSGDTLPTGLNWISHVVRWISERLRRQRLVCPTHNASQIFIISAEGRPMVEEDALSAVMTVVQPNRRRRRVCTTARCLLFLLSVFTALALVAATLPWILLA